jgi:urease accessory protein UreF
MVAALLPECGTDDILRWHERHGFDTHFTVVFALSMKRTDATIDETRTLYLYMAARDQVCAAIRLGLLGPQHAHRLLHTVYCDPHIMNFHPDAGYQDACKTAPMIDVAQANHVHVYAKLFQT